MKILQLLRKKGLKKASPEKNPVKSSGRMLIQPRKKSSSRRAEHTHAKMILWIYFQQKIAWAHWK
jgi:hypothetical protein